MFEALPPIGREIMEWTEIAPLYADLVDRPLTTDTVDEWLADWSRLARVVSETDAILFIATTRNTTDKEAEQKRIKFLEEITPAVNAAEQKLKQKLLESRLEPVGFTMQLR